MITINKLFKDSWNIYTKQFKTLILITILTFLPIAAFQGLIEYYENNFNIGDFSGINFALIALIVLSLFISWVGKGAIIKNIDTNKGIRKSLDYGWNNLISIIWVDILTLIIVIIGFILFIIPGILFFIWYAFALMVLIIENKKGWQALLESREMVKGKWWNIFAKLFILYFIVMIINVLLSVAFGLVNESRILTNAIFAIVMVLFTPFIFSYTYIMYKDLKGGAKNE